MEINIFILLLSLLFSLISYKFLIPILKKTIIAEVNNRSSHKTSTPSGGGIVIVLVSSILGLIFNEKIFITCLPLSIIGLIDDIRDIKPFYRYLIQVITVMTLLSLETSTYISSIDNIYIKLLFYFITIFCSTALINFTNFMDGIDGLVSCCMVLYFTFIAFLYFPSASLVLPPLLAFIPFNKSPSKIFMGDIGSTFLGALLVGFLIRFNNLDMVLSVLFITIPFYGDAIFTLIIRLISGKNIFQAHKDHLYQRLVQSNLSHSAVTIIYLGVSSLNALCYVFLGKSCFVPLIIVNIMIGYYYNNKIAKKFDPHF